MKLSVVIICWNDLKVIGDCLASIFAHPHNFDLEVIVSDNGSSDGSIDFIRQRYPSVRLIENNANLGFARGNNVGIHAARGQYILILNPDTLIHPGAFNQLIDFADQHPLAGAFGCRVLNADGSFQKPAQVFPSIPRYWLEAFYLHKLARFSDLFACGEYGGWDGTTSRPIDWQCGCCVMFRSCVLRQIGGFDERFFYHFEEVDLCKRVWEAGYPVLYTPDPVITHLAGQSVNRFPVRFALEKLRNRYRYFHKHFGPQSLPRCRRVILTNLYIRQTYFTLKRLFHRTPSSGDRLTMYRAVIAWNKHLNPLLFVLTGAEPIPAPPPPPLPQPQTSP